MGFMPSVGELLIIGVIAALIFGPKQIPKLGRSVGEALREFRNVGKELRSGADLLEEEVASVKHEVESAVDDATRGVR